ncbi:DUF6098 family protein [Pseudoclavibacter sp. RFBA6]|uniref:DUF6098 family protein n=1 Tax=Pseudoclavibacter sp. RFBA6 TaxID=2080573 RepID=UPI000CE8E337|nr:DUF6098 family protein [Pseudoclavibacter sp. RFBA6]PPG38752.1 hypothetical protein C5C17_13775 [Pseudoclavibacter sp. RFBA6]
MDELPVLNALSALRALVATRPGLHVRYSEGPAKDAEQRSLDTESGLQLPGLSVNPLDPEPWWTRPIDDWLARQLCQYEHLAASNPDRYAWVLRGRHVGRGPDCEPLLDGIEPVARLAPCLLEEARHRYEMHFAAEQGPESDE